MTRLRCASCGHALTQDCRWGWLEDHDPQAYDRTPAVPAGLMVVLPGGIVSTNPADLLSGSLCYTGYDVGCCGSDGGDGPNRACSGCGAVLGTERSDCWTAAVVDFLRTAVQLDAVKPGGEAAAVGALRPFEREALAYARDGGTVQNLLRLAAKRWPDLPKDAALRVLRGLLNHDMLRIHEDDAGMPRDFDAAAVLHERIAAQSYTWLKAIPGTMARLSAEVPSRNPRGLLSG